MNTNLNPEDWLTNLDAGITNAPLAHPRMKDFAEQVAIRTSELRNEHQLVESLAQLRRTAALTQVDVARNWGRSQSRVSSIESGTLASVEIGTLVEYVRALKGTVEIRVTVADHTYIEKLA
jgi:predicted XRE-type DNA-binding protein